MVCQKKPSAVIPKTLVDNQIRKVVESKAEQLFKSRAKTGTGVLLAVIYHPRFHNLSNTIRKLFIYLYGGEQVKKGFTPALFVSFRSGYILTIDLARTKVHSLIREKGSSIFIVIVNVLLSAHQKADSIKRLI